MKRIIDIFIFVIGLIFIYFQFNDPDPIYWIPVYATMSLLALLQILDKSNTVLALVISLCLGLAFAWYMPQIITWMKDGMPSVTGSMKASSPYIELVREAGGLFIAMSTAIYYYFVSKNSKH